MDIDRFAESLAGLLPQGYAWPRATNAVLMSVVRAQAAQHAQFTAEVHAMVRQWQPATTVARLAEWEASCGLPDLCLGNVQTEAQRRQVLLRTLRGPVLPLADSSPAAPAVIQAACREIGFEVTLAYNTPMRIGERVGTRLGALDGRLYVFVASRSQPMRGGVGRVGDRLVERNLPPANLTCFLERLIPARYSINPIYL